jgi:pyridoxal phosphate phosphatase PHOSPHO2
MAIQWVLEKYGLYDLFSGCYTNIAELEDNRFIKINQWHEHDCETCDKSICKRIVVDNHLKQSLVKYANLFYLGDGENDYCPALLFGEGDYLFPRHGFALHNLLYGKNYIEKLKCNVISWENANVIIEVLKKLL